MIDTRAIVILYTGNEITPEGATNIAEYIATLLGLGIMPKLHTLDSEDMAKSIVLNNIETVAKPAVKNQYTAEENAIIYIGTRFKEALMSRNIIAFTSELSAEATIAKISGVNDALTNAIRIITNGRDSSVNANLAKKYHMTKQVFDVIRRVGQNV